MIRLLLTAIVIAFTIYFIYNLLSIVRNNMCPNCEGKGYWLGTRSDKNHCKACDGSGRTPVNSTQS
ncbi:MAG: hypothetical protein AAFO03_12020 [Bacteroidota bacterium]